jgi:MFS family permease
MLAAGILVYRLSKSAFLLGLVGFSQFVGVFLLVRWTGAAADRFDRRRLVFVTQGAASTLAAALAVIVLTGSETVAIVIGFVLAIGFVQAFTFPALNAMVPELVPPERLGPAVALKAVSHNLARGLGPAFASLVIATAGIEWAFVVNACAYLALVAGLLMVRPLSSPERPQSYRLRDSLAILRRRPRLAGFMLVSATTAIATDPVNTLTPAFAVDVWDRTDTMAGLLLGAFSLGAVTAALTVAGRPGNLRRQLAVRLSLMAGGMIAFAVAPAIEAGVACLVVAGFGFLASITAAIKELQLGVDDPHRGRMMALWSVAFLGVRPFASLVDGALANAASPRVSTLVMSIPAVLLVGVLLTQVTTGSRPPSPRGRRRVPRARAPVRSRST